MRWATSPRCRNAAAARMLRQSIASIACCLLLASAVVPAVAGDATVEAERQRLADSVRRLSSDDWEGRGVGTEGLNRAAEYIADQFAQLGLTTRLFQGTPFQQFSIPADARLGPPQNNHLTLVGPPSSPGGSPRRLQLQLGRDFTPLSLGASGEFDLPLVFSGYGISGKNEKYDDYADVDVTDKAVLILRKEPQQDDPQSIFNGTRSSRHAYFNRKVANAYEHGAAAVLIVNDHVTLRDQQKSRAEAWSASTEKLAQKLAALRAEEDLRGAQLAPLREQITKLARQVHEAGKSLTADPDTLLGFRDAGQSDKTRIPVVFCRRAAIAPALASAFGQKTLPEVEAEIDRSLTPQTRELAGWRVAGQVQLLREKTDVRNVVAVLEGDGRLADETVVVGAHYDHLGRGGRGSLARWTNDIHNGADDNASGTAVLLEVARQLATAPPTPRRRIVFIAFTAEERGLLGSKHYVRQPRFPLEKTVAMVNMDMVGRLTNNQLTVYGTGTAQGFAALLDKVNSKYEFAITKQPSGTGPSDHASFYGQQIPVLHLFTGMHRDYHRPSDDFPTLNLRGMHRIARMATDIVRSLASDDDRPEYQKTQRRRRGRTKEGG